MCLYPEKRGNYNKQWCIGLDWEQGSKKCFLHHKGSVKWGGPYKSKTADHYMRCGIGKSGKQVKVV